MTKPQLWTKDFILISLNNFFTHIVFYILMVTIALYVTKEFNTSPSMAGLSIGIFVLASLVARIFAGKYMDRIGRKRAMIGALIVFTIAMFLHILAEFFCPSYAHSFDSRGLAWLHHNDSRCDCSRLDSR